jgi:SAM-dependent methyltransferase
VRNIDSWSPSKLAFDPRRNRYIPHRLGVSLGSRLAISAQAGPYERLIREYSRGRLLDCGCGRVPFYDMYKDLVTSITCIDWNESSHVDLVVDLNGALPFDDQSFDTVLLSDVLEHVREPGQLLREISRVLAPPGTLILTVPFLYHVHEAPHDYYRYTRFALEALCHEGGFVMEELAPYGGYPDVLLDLVNKGLAPIAPLCELFLSTVPWITRTGPYEAWRRRTAERFPLGYCLVARKPTA